MSEGLQFRIYIYIYVYIYIYMYIYIGFTIRQRRAGSGLWIQGSGFAGVPQVVLKCVEPWRP